MRTGVAASASKSANVKLVVPEPACGVSLALPVASTESINVKFWPSVKGITPTPIAPNTPKEPVHVTGPRLRSAMQFSDSEPTVVVLEAVQESPLRELSWRNDRNPERSGPAVDNSKVLVPENVEDAKPGMSSLAMAPLNELVMEVGVLESV